MILSKKVKSTVALGLLLSSSGLILPELIHADQTKDITVQEENKQTRGSAKGDITPIVGSGSYILYKFRSLFKY